MKTVLFYGMSGSGKTSIICDVVSKLTKKGHSVCAVKHVHEGYNLDPRGKDTSKIFQSGAHSVAAVGPDGSFIVTKEGAFEAVKSFMKADFLVVEGFQDQHADLRVLVAGRAIEPEYAQGTPPHVVIGFIKIKVPGVQAMTYKEMGKLVKMIISLNSEPAETGKENAQA